LNEHAAGRAYFARQYHFVLSAMAISFGFNIRDQDERPILFNDAVRPFMFKFMARRLNVQ
jgi:hypothetical protein